MGLRKGDTVLIHYRRGSDLYQSVLIMQDADLKQGKVSPEQHKYWRHVAPVRSYFDWLPERIANTFYSTALEAFAGRHYGELEHLEEMENLRCASMYFQNIHHIGDTKSGQELEVFLTMPLEQDMIDCKIGKILIQSRTNLNGGELERGLRQKERKARRPPTHRFRPSVFRALTTLVEFHYRTLEPKQLEPKRLRNVVQRLTTDSRKRGK